MRSKWRSSFTEWSKDTKAGQSSEQQNGKEDDRMKKLEDELKKSTETNIPSVLQLHRQMTFDPLESESVFGFFPQSRFYWPLSPPAAMEAQ